MRHDVPPGPRHLLTSLAVAISLLTTPAKSEADPVTIRTSMSWFTTATMQSPVPDSPLNPDNSVAGIESQIGTIDIRPNLKLDSGNFQIVARPQLKTSTAKSTVNKTESSEHPRSSGRWTEAYGVLTASNKVLVSYGLQNYQWGAAESLNPSNRIFHETIDSKGVMSVVQGRQIARANLSWTKNLTTILMSETDQVNDINAFRAEETFQTRSLMKHEVNWNSGADYLGVVYGAPEKGSPWIGGYFNLSLFDGLTLYGDASQQRSSEAWYPVLETSSLVSTQKVVQLRQSKLYDQKTYTIAVGGLRYSFEGGSDLRFEYLANSAGWTKDDNKNASIALDTTRNLQLTDYKTNLKRALLPGLEYRGQKYALISLRVPDALTFKDLTLYARAMRSLNDFSSIYYGSLEYGFWSASTLIVSAFMSQGSAETDLRGIVASSVTGGLRQDF